GPACAPSVACASARWAPPTTPPWSSAPAASCAAWWSTSAVGCASSEVGLLRRRGARRARADGGRAGRPHRRGRGQRVAPAAGTRPGLRARARLRPPGEPPGGCPNQGRGRGGRHRDPPPAHLAIGRRPWRRRPAARRGHVAWGSRRARERSLPMSVHTGCRGATRGATLVELLVGTALAALVLGACVGAVAAAARLLGALGAR